MTELPSGFEVHSQYLETSAVPAHEADSHRVIFRDPIDNSLNDITMHATVKALREVFRDPSISCDPVIEQYTEKLRSYGSRSVLHELEGRGGKPSPFRLQPSYTATLKGSVRLLPSDFYPTTELLGKHVSRADLIAFCSHVMTYTALEESDDPRLALIDELRSAALK